MKGEEKPREEPGWMEHQAEKAKIETWWQSHEAGVAVRELVEAADRVCKSVIHRDVEGCTICTLYKAAERVRKEMGL